jgi:two-component system, chemotaxis family, sensor kinase CheA
MDGSDDLLREFLSETTENLGLLDQQLVELERSPGDPGLLGGIFRVFHTIKGTCGFLGLPRLEHVAHAAENVLGRIRDGALAVTPDTVTLVLEALDCIKSIIVALATTQKEPPGDDAPLIARLDRLAAGAGDDAPTVPTPLPTPDSAPAETSERGPGAQAIRVAVDLLEDLMALVSELVLTRNQLLQTLRNQKDSAFAAPLQRLSQVTTELQEGVMKTRMQPIGGAWAKLPRLVRELARELDKKIDLRLVGAETELDRHVLEMVRDPLTHMVRNCADHGVEPPAQRIAAGKPDTGTISLNAYHAGGYIVVEIADDGAGLDLDHIRQKALAGGLATPAEIAAMSEHQIQQFIFRPGFSTAAKVTSVSGRGVGMDVVRTNIEKIGGTVELRSKAGGGSRFTLAIPLTLAIVSALIVECAGERFAFPQINVVELVRVAQRSGHAIEWLLDAPVLRLRERILPLVSLRALLGLGDARDPGPEILVIVTQVGSQRFGIMVDRVFDAEEIVVKPVAPLLRDIAIYSGNTILGDGRVIMILDPNGIAAAASLATNEAERPAPAPAPALEHAFAEQQTVILFRAGGSAPKAVPLAMVTRLEAIDRDRIERAGGALVVQYRGKLMPLLRLDEGQQIETAGQQPVLVFVEGQRSTGLVVDEIIDIVEDSYQVELSGDRPGIVGSAVISGMAADLIDVSHYLARSGENWFETEKDGDYGAVAAKNRVLLVDDSAFFRNMLHPLLSAAGYAVTTAASVDDALRLRDEGEIFDVIVSDIEMPRTDGFGFAAKIRGSQHWAGTPLIALTSHATARDRERTRESGFHRHIPKSDHRMLLQAISETIAGQRGTE